MNFRAWGRSRVIDVLLIAALAIAGPIPAFATETHQFDVPVEDAPSAIRDFASQAHVQILVAGENVREKHLHSVAGEFSTEEGLRLLLADSGLSPQYVGDRSIALVKATDTNSSPQGDGKEGKKSSSEEFRVAQANPGLAQGASSVATSTGQNSPNGQSGAPALTEIIVTAQKRSERLQDVPVPVTALSAESLVEQNQLRLQDYYTSVPGLAFASRFDGSPQLAIRGISTGTSTNPTVGVTVDDVPYGSSTSLGGSAYIPDIDPSDLARIEVLRGPQGTLYGANSIGGLLKYVTVDPSTDQVSGRVQAGVSSVYSGDTVGYNVSASINVPVTDTLAVRASGFTRRDPGYIDDVETGRRDVNEVDVSGGRFAALWRPSQDFSLKLSALIQDSNLHGAPYVELGTGFGDLQQSVLQGTGRAHKQLEAYSATVNAKLGSVDLVSVSGYNINRASDINDLSFIPFFAPGGASTNDTKNSKFTQEFRLSGSAGPAIDWLGGGFYTHEHTPYVQTIETLDPATGSFVSTLYNATFPTTYTEYAAFGDLTVHFTSRFDIQFGGRDSHVKETYSEVDTGPFVGPIPSVEPLVETSSNSFTYLITPKFNVSPDLMLYARFASGYRPGGPNSQCILNGVPCTFGADKTSNYDLGIKGDLDNHAILFDASVYYIDWKNIQISLTTPNGIYNYFANASRASSKGAELSGTFRPLAGLSIAAWVAWNDAKLTEDFPQDSIAAGGAYGTAGDRLPYSARFSGNVSVQQDFSITSRVSGFAGAALSYVGPRLSEFSTSPERTTLRGYAQANLRGGVKFDDWTVNLFVNNVADKRGPLYGGLGSPNPSVFYYIQPRIAGLSVSRAF